MAPKMPTAVLFLCGHNAIRSPMAEALLRQYRSKKIFTASAGIHKGQADGFMQAVMQEKGLDLSHHESRLLDDLIEDGELEQFELIITLSPEAHHRALDLTRSLAVDVEYWPTPDPSIGGETREQKLQNYRTVCAMLENRIHERWN
jgi:protein-tyrosine-phosphatase